MPLAKPTIAPWEVLSQFVENKPIHSLGTNFYSLEKEI